MRHLVLALLVCACGRTPVEHAVTIRGMSFDPPALTVTAGDKVRFENEDIVAHTATAAGRFDSGPIAPQASWVVTIGKKGDVAYACTLHPMMTGSITAR
jgi:plastocyanin